MLYYVQDMCVCPQPPTKTSLKGANSLEEKALAASAAPTVPTESIDEIFAKRKPQESGKDLGRSTGDHRRP